MALAWPIYAFIRLMVIRESWIVIRESWSCYPF